MGDEQLEYEVVEEEENALQEEEAYLEEDAALEEAEDEAGQGGNGDNGGAASKDQASSGGEINTTTFVELVLDIDVATAARNAWNLFVSSAASTEAASEAVYSALFEAAPSLQVLFVSPRAVQAMKFYAGVNALIGSLDDPPGLKLVCEAQGFGHLDKDVTVPRVIVFRDAILDLLAVELGDRLTNRAITGIKAMLNYFGGALIWTKANFAERLFLLAESWKTATAGEKDKAAAAGEKDEAGGGQVKEADDAGQGGKKKKKGKGNKKRKDGGEEKGEGEGKDGKAEKGHTSTAQNVPTTFNEMFQFNAAVMGYSTSLAWMNEVLACFHNLVTNVQNSARFQEECDFLMLRCSVAIQQAQTTMNMNEFKSCMLASLRSCLPKIWSMPHEVAWSWLWENVEKLVLVNFGRPPKWEKGLTKFLGSLDEATAYKARKAIYETFFVLCPPGQYFFKQSDAYLHIIASKVLVMTMDIFREPTRMVDDVSALGLRHVGYAIPTEYMPFFVTASIDVVQGSCKDEVAVEGFRYSIGLVGKSLVRTILEGSTVVMKAINNNTLTSIFKALQSAPRSERSQWCLLVQVGTQNISPFAWSLEAGSLNSTTAIIRDLLSFWADRDNYYYGMDELFIRHPDVVKRLAVDASTLLNTLFDGLLWRSTVTVNGTRRVNYYIRHLLITLNGKFAKNLEWISELHNPKLVTHPVLAVCADLAWSRIAYRKFLMKKSWVLFTLVLFLVGQSVLFQYKRGERTDAINTALFVFRILIYLLGMVPLIQTHVVKTVAAYRSKSTTKLLGKIAIPEYLHNVMDLVSFLLGLSLFIMFVTEPIFHCMFAGHSGFTSECDTDKNFFPYSVFSMISMCLFYMSLFDMTVFVTRFCAFGLACGRLCGEVALFILALAFVTVTFGCSLNCLDQSISSFHGPPQASLTLFKTFMRMVSPEVFDSFRAEWLVTMGAFTFMFCTLLFIFNMLIAQLCCSYDNIYRDMLGLARLYRIDIIVETIPQVSEVRWKAFVESMAFDKKLEFNAGDIGLPGGIQVLEPANAHPTNRDIIKRFGGSTDIKTPWPATDDDENDDSYKFERLEKSIQKALQLATTKTKKGAGSSKLGSSMASGSKGSGDGGGGSGGGSGEGE